MVLLALVWFGLRFLNSMSLVEPNRAEVVAWNLADFVAIVLLFLAVCVERLREEQVFSLRAKSDKVDFRLLAVWFGSCVASALTGVLRGHDWSYLIGDFYRFACLSVVLTLLYFSAPSRARVEYLLRGFVAVYGLMVGLDLVRFNAFLREGRDRLTTETAHQAGMICAAVIYLMLFDQKRWVRRLSVVLLILMTILLVRAQMLSPLLSSLAAMSLYFIFSRKFAVLLGLAVGGVILVLASFYSVTVMPANPEYIANKFLLAQQSQGPLESLEALSGVRLGEIISIAEELANNPVSLLLGTGAGSLLTPDPVLDPILPIARYTMDKHYVHSGFFDALYHNGIIAVGAFLLLALHLFRRAKRIYAAGNPFGLFVMVTLLVTLLLLSYDFPFESAVPMFGLCFSGVSTMEPMPRAASKRVRTRMRPSGMGAASVCGPAGA